IFPDLQLFFFQSMGLDLLWNQMLPANMPFFIFCIAADLYDLHSVQKRSWYGLKIVCSSNKQDIRQIQRDLYIIIPEFYILFRVKDLQKCGRSISLIIAAYLVDLIQEH